MKNKKGQAIQELQSLVVGLITAGVILVVGFLIMAEAGSEAVSTAGAQNLTNCSSAACNGTKETISAIAEIPGWLGIIVIAVIGGAIIGLVTTLFKRR